MGAGVTVACLGYGPLVGSRRRVYCAMNRLEIMQETIRAKREGETIEYWEAQTKGGEKILGDRIVMADRVPKAKYIKCVCKDGCFICRQTGITSLAWLKGFQDWQIEMARTQEV